MLSLLQGNIAEDRNLAHYRSDCQTPSCCLLRLPLCNPHCVMSRTTEADTNRHLFLKEKPPFKTRTCVLRPLKCLVLKKLTPEASELTKSLARLDGYQLQQLSVK